MTPVGQKKQKMVSDAHMKIYPTCIALESNTITRKVKITSISARKAPPRSKLVYNQ
jgi:hypothetical protein